VVIVCPHVTFPLPLPQKVHIELCEDAAEKLDSKGFADNRLRFLQQLKEDLPNPERWKLKSLDFRSVGKKGIDGLDIAKFNTNQSRCFCKIIYKNKGKTVTIYIADISIKHKNQDKILEKVIGMRIQEFNENKDNPIDKSIEGKLPKDWDSRTYTEIPNGLSNHDFLRTIEWAKKENDIRLVLTAEQLSVIKNKSPILINGQAGTGKSTMLAYRIAYSLDGEYLPAQCQDCFEELKEETCSKCEGTKIDQTIPKKAKGRKMLVTCYSSRLVQNISGWVEKILNNLDIIQKVSKEEKKSDRRKLDIAVAPVDFIPFPKLARNFIPTKRVDSRGKFTADRRNKYESDLDRVTFARFKREFFLRDKSMHLNYPAEYVYHAIRTYIKGMALGSERLLKEEDWNTNQEISEYYSQKQWKDMLSYAGNYEQYLSEHKLWDDIDLTWEALRSIEKDEHRFCNRCQGYKVENFTNEKTVPFGISKIKGKNKNKDLKRKKVEFQDVRWVKNCKHCDDEGKIDRLSTWNYNEIYLDEAQDLTKVEFNFLTQLIHEDNGITAVKPGQYPLILAGDPNQTVNPTGFSWKQIVQLIFRDGSATEVHELTTNHRSHEQIVRLSNFVQKARRGYLDQKDSTLRINCKKCGDAINSDCQECNGTGKVSINLQESPNRKKSMPQKHKPVAYRLSNKDDTEAISGFINNVATNSINIRFIIAQEDFKEVINFLIKDSVFSKAINNVFRTREECSSCKGEGKTKKQQNCSKCDGEGFLPSDNILKSLLDKYNRNIQDRIWVFGGTEWEPLELDLALEYIMEKFNIFTISGIKGQQFDSVVLYNFSSDEIFRKWINHTLEIMEYNEMEYISLMFHLNRLYISMTRPMDYLLIFDASDDIWLNDKWVSYVNCDNCQGALVNGFSECKSCNGITTEKLIDDTHWGRTELLGTHPLLMDQSDQKPFDIGKRFFELGSEEPIDPQLLIRAKSKFEESTDPLARGYINQIDALLAENKRNWEFAGKSWRKLGKWERAAGNFQKAKKYRFAADCWKILADVKEKDTTEYDEIMGQFHSNVMKINVKNVGESEIFDCYDFVMNTNTRKWIENSDIIILADRFDEFDNTGEKSFELRTKILGDDESILRAINKSQELEEYERVMTFLEMPSNSQIKKKFKSEYIACLKKMVEKDISSEEYWNAASRYTRMAKVEEKSIAKKRYWNLAGDNHVRAKLSEYIDAQKSFVNAKDCYSSAESHLDASLCKFLNQRPTPKESIKILGEVIEKFSTLRKILQENYSKDDLTRKLVQIGKGMEGKQFTDDSEALGYLVTAYIFVQNIAEAEQKIKKALGNKKGIDKTPIYEIYANFLIGQNRHSEAVTQFENAGQLENAVRHAKKHGLEIDTKHLKMIAAEKLQTEFKNKSNKNNKSTIKLEERNIWLELGDEEKAKQCLNDALSVEANIDKQITIILEHSLTPGEAIDSAVKLIPKNSKTNNSQKISILRHMLNENVYDELSNYYTLHRVIEDWIKEKGVKDDFDSEEIGKILELSGKRNAKEIVAYYQKIKPPTRWSLEGCLRWIDPYIEATEEITRTTDWTQQAVVKMLIDSKQEWKELLSDNTNFKVMDKKELELSKKKVSELKEICKLKGLNVSGKKAELIERILNNS